LTSMKVSTGWYFDIPTAAQKVCAGHEMLDRWLP